MTVAELIDKLQEYDPELTVTFPDVNTGELYALQKIAASEQATSVGDVLRITMFFTEKLEKK
jgi:ABC-type Fe3+ transport system substrate-binding protein